MNIFDLGTLAGLSFEEIVRYVLSQSLFGPLAVFFSVVGDLATLALTPLSLFRDTFLG